MGVRTVCIEACIKSKPELINLDPLKNQRNKTIIAFKVANINAVSPDIDVEFTFINMVLCSANALCRSRRRERKHGLNSVFKEQTVFRQYSALGMNCTLGGPNYLL